MFFLRYFAGGWEIRLPFAQACKGEDDDRGWYVFHTKLNWPEGSIFCFGIEGACLHSDRLRHIGIFSTHVILEGCLQCFNSIAIPFENVRVKFRLIKRTGGLKLAEAGKWKKDISRGYLDHQLQQKRFPGSGIVSIMLSLSGLLRVPASYSRGGSSF